MNYLTVLLLFGLSMVSEVMTKSGRLLVKTKRGVEYEVSSKNCVGVFLKAPNTIYDFRECVCVTGIWAFYEEHCGEPTYFVGGHNYCFGLNPLQKVVQIALIGNFRDPFEPSISHFQDENFVQLTVTVSDNEYNEYNRLELDALGSWITVTNTEWTLFSETGDSLCLKPTIPGHRVHCTYNKRLLKTIETMKWNYVVHVQTGCHTNATVKADACYPFRRPNDKSKCRNTKPDVTPCPDPADPGDQNPQDPFCLPDNNNTNSTTTTRKPVITSITTAQPPICGVITRETVKDYWLDPVENQCGKTITEAILKDQLRRYATTRLDKIFQSRLESLEQMKQMIIHSRDIMKKTCIDDYVPNEFFDVAAEAFLMIITEDFFYGVEGIDQNSFGRVITSLRKCWKRAKAFVFQSVPIACDHRQVAKITGWLILPGQTVQLDVPDHARAKLFEPLIETTWKIFLNAHAYCFEDFQIPNDHHHFSVLFLELFSKTVYEKWIEHLPTRELYKFIVPKFPVMQIIQENIDWCVAATGKISKCPVWMIRSNPHAKPIIPDFSSLSNKGTTKSQRKKRSTWVHGINSEAIKIWDDTAYCLQHMIDPQRYGLASCSQAF